MTPPLAPSPDTQQNSAFAIPFDLRIAKCNKISLRCDVTTPCGDEHNYSNCRTIILQCKHCGEIAMIKPCRKILSQPEYKFGIQNFCKLAQDQNIMWEAMLKSEKNVTLMWLKIQKTLLSLLMQKIVNHFAAVSISRFIYWIYLGDSYTTDP